MSRRDELSGRRVVQVAVSETRTVPVLLDRNEVMISKDKAVKITGVKAAVGDYRRYMEINPYQANPMIVLDVDTATVWTECNTIDSRRHYSDSTRLVNINSVLRGLDLQEINMQNVYKAVCTIYDKEA